MERALLVTVRVDSERDAWSLEDNALELEELAAASGAQVIDNIAVKRDKPAANLFIGKGKAEELSLICFEQKIDTVIFSHDLSATQQRNLEEAIGKKTIDRTQLILDIFARHAKTPEGKIQVELAQLQYLMPRLVGKGVILSRLGGGIGTRGPGEQKLESDRRRIRKKVDKLKEDLRQVSSHRANLRKKRKENAIPSIALVGYTNAGKSTLLNALTQADQAVADSLFTTLDPLSRSVTLPNGTQAVVSDTVGFLHNLPHHLVEAFKATLEEVTEADLLIHVVDMRNPLVFEHHKAVGVVLKELDCLDKPMITALNKIDLLEGQSAPKSINEAYKNPVAISAKLGKNIDVLLERVQEHFQERMKAVQLLISHSRMDLVNQCYKEGKVKEVKYLQKGVKIKVYIPIISLNKLLQNKEIEKVS